MTRSGIEKRQHGVVRRAAATCPSLNGRKISPHTLRHTTAMHRLQAGVDVNSIALWLGHVNRSTTHAYVGADLAIAVLAFRAGIRGADAVLLAAPEYAGAIAGVVKNALDWIVGSGDLYGKAVALLSAGTSGVFARRDLMRTLRWQGAHVVASLGIEAANTKSMSHSDGSRRITDPNTLNESERWRRLSSRRSRKAPPSGWPRSRGSHATRPSNWAPSPITSPRRRRPGSGSGTCAKRRGTLSQRRSPRRSRRPPRAGQGWRQPVLPMP